MTVKITISITVPEDEADVNRVEREVEEALSRARQALWEKTLARVESVGLLGEGLRRERRRERWLLTRGGWVRFTRYVVWDAREGKHYCALDRMIGLDLRQRATLAIQQRGVELATSHPYRAAAALLGREAGGDIRHMAVWRWVQQSGQQERRRRIAERESVFGRGEQPSRAARAPALVVGEMDGTMIRLQRRQGHIEVKCGVLYSRKEKTGRRRWRVQDKVTRVGIEPMDEFAEGWWLAGERAFRISDAGHLLLITDGLDIYRDAVRDYFPGVVHQLDRWHLADRLHSVVQDDEREETLLDWLRDGKEAAVLRWLEERSYPGREEKHRDLLAYLRNNRFSLNAVRTLPSEIGAPELRRVGSGVIEKTVGVLIARRFKGQGRSWSPEGARNLLALCEVRYNNQYPLKGELINPNPIPIPVSLN